MARVSRPRKKLKGRYHWQPTYKQRKFWEKQRDAALDRDGGWCQECWPDRAVYATDVHHIRSLGMGGSRYDPENPLNNLENLVSLCRPCHWVKHNRTSGGPGPERM